MAFYYHHSYFSELFKEVNLSKKGRCKQGSYESMINLMFVYSVEQQLPIYYRITPGNIRDIKSFKLSLEESQIRDATIIIDKGFYSKANIKLIKSEGLQFIIPLKRNSSMIQYGKNETSGKGNKVKINDTWHLAEITKKTKETLDKLELPIT